MPPFLASLPYQADASTFREGVYFAQNLTTGFRLGGAGLGCLLSLLAVFQFYTAIKMLEEEPIKYAKINEGESDLTKRLNLEAGY